MKENERKIKRCCIGVLAHVDAGKTTLSEALLYRTLSVGHPRAINPSLELLNSIKESDYLKKNTEIIIERKDVIYKVHSNVETL